MKDTDPRLFFAHVTLSTSPLLKCPSLCSDCSHNFGFAPSATESVIERIQVEYPETMAMYGSRSDKDQGKAPTSDAVGSKTANTTRDALMTRRFGEFCRLFNSRERSFSSSTNHLSTASFTILVWSVSVCSKLVSCSSSFTLQV